MKIYGYALHIIGGRGCFDDFETRDELIEALKYRGLPLSLADFDGKVPDKYGMVKNQYQNASAIAYYG